jgi:hypothetical protein
MYNRQCSPPFFILFCVFALQRKNALYAYFHPPILHSFVVKSIQFFLDLTDYGVSRQVFFGDKGRGVKRQDAILKLSDALPLTPACVL